MKMKVKRQVIPLLAVLIFVAGCTPATQPAAQAPQPAVVEAPKPSQFDPDKDAFLTARKATDAKTWSSANLLLKRIDVDKIQDVDVLAYVDFAKRCAQLASDLGIDIRANPDSSTSVLESLNAGTFIAKLWKTIDEKGLQGAAEIVGRANQIRKELPTFLELDQTLSRKYGG